MNRKLRSLTYSRGDIYDRTIDPDFLQKDCPLDQLSPALSLASTTPTSNPTASLGTFDNLPLETIHNIFSNLDLATLTSLRSVSKCMTHFVDSLLPYTEILTYAPNALRALLSTGAAHYFTPDDLRTALRAQDCFLCDRRRFGAFLYLLQCRRCCWQCLVKSRDLMPIVKSAARDLYHLDQELLNDLPSVLTIPGSYGPKQRRRPGVRTMGMIRVPLVAYGAARKAGTDVQEALTAGDHYEKAKLETRIALRGPLAQDTMRDQDCMNYDPVGYKAGYGLEPQRFMVAIRFPTLLPAALAHSRSRGGVKVKLEWGLSCLGCLEHAKEGEEEKCWNVLFTIRGMARHLVVCDKAKKAWVDDRVAEVRDRFKGPEKKRLR